MNKFKKYILGALALVAATAALPACQDSFDEPNGDNVPVADWTANTTLAEVKEWLWKDAANYCDTVYTREWYTTPEADRTPDMKTNGTHIIVKGRVTSSDYAGNCFKYIILDDGTASLSFSINSYNLYLNYRRGQEVYVDLTGLHMGKYRGLLQVGFPSYNSSIPGYETSFMAPEMFARNAQLNGLPEVAKLDTMSVNSFAELGVSPADLRNLQSRLVRFNNVEFVPNATVPTLSTHQSSGVTQQIRDQQGNVLDVRTSGYANFWNMKLPEGRCDVVAILGYYINLAGAGGWQLTLLDANSILNVGNPTSPKGLQNNPYSVMEAIALEVNSQGQSGWVEGYIVGTVKEEVNEVKTSSDIDFTATPVLGNTIVLGQTADSRSLDECVVIALPQGSDLRKFGAIRENPSNLGKKMSITGTFDKVMGTYGITGNDGSAAGFTIEGVEVGPEKPAEGDGTEASPYLCQQVIAFNPQSTTEAVKTGVWVSGYIVGYYENYAAHFETSTTQAANVLLSDDPAASDVSQCVCVQLLVSTDVRAKLNLIDNPAMLGKKVAVLGDIMKYNTIPGIKNTSAYKLEGDSPEPPVQPGATYKGDFNSFNGGQPKSTYGTYTNATGWTLTNGCVLSGLAAGGTDQNPKFGFIGDASTLAVLLNGKSSALGSVESPVLKGGCSKITFNYGFPFTSDTKAAFTVSVLQGENVVVSKVITVDPIVAKTAISYTLDAAVTGDFRIKIVNNGLSAKDANTDRVAIWNLTWE